MTSALPFGRDHGGWWHPNIAKASALLAELMRHGVEARWHCESLRFVAPSAQLETWAAEVCSPVAPWVAMLVRWTRTFEQEAEVPGEVAHTWRNVLTADDRAFCWSQALTGDHIAAVWLMLVSPDDRETPRGGSGAGAIQ